MQTWLAWPCYLTSFAFDVSYKPTMLYRCFSLIDNKVFQHIAIIASFRRRKGSFEKYLNKIDSTWFTKYEIIRNAWEWNIQSQIPVQPVSSKGNIRLVNVVYGGVGVRIASLQFKTYWCLYYFLHLPNLLQNSIHFIIHTSLYLIILCKSGFFVTFH